MKKVDDFLILDADGEEIFNALTTDFVANVIHVGNFYAVKIFTDDGFNYIGGVYSCEAKAQKNLNQFIKNISAARRGENKFEGFEFNKDEEVSATALLDSLFDSGDLVDEDFTDAGHKNFNNSLD